MSPEGAFEVYLSPQRMGENWLENAADTDTLIVRQIYADWNAAYPGQIHIDRVDTLGTPRPAYTTADFAAWGRQLVGGTGDWRSVGARLL